MLALIHAKIFIEMAIAHLTLKVHTICFVLGKNTVVCAANTGALPYSRGAPIICLTPMIVDATEIKGAVPNFGTFTINHPAPNQKMATVMDIHILKNNTSYKSPGAAGAVCIEIIAKDTACIKRSTRGATILRVYLDPLHCSPTVSDIESFTVDTR